MPSSRKPVSARSKQVAKRQAQKAQSVGFNPKLTMAENMALSNAKAKTRKKK